MASYSNLTSLEGLQVGDIVTYTANTVIDTKGYKIKVEMYAGGRNAYGTGGYTTAVIDSSKLPEKTISLLESNRSWSLAYGSFSTYASCLYYRFLVAGGAGAGRHAERTGSGGGATGTNGVRYSDAYSYPGEGGTQTSGGAGGKSGGNFTTAAYNGSAGTFGYGGAKCTNASFQTYSYNGGDGWYGGGGTGAYKSTSYPTGAGGGSGFIIGNTTTIYPSGYMGDNTSLIETITSAVSEGTTIQAGGVDSTTLDSTKVRTVFTILENGSSSLYQEDVSAAQDGSVMLTIEASETEGEYTATISGTGDIKDFYYPDDIFDNVPENYSNITTCIVEEGITKISRYCFRNVETLINISLPNSLTSIDDGAFINADNIQKIEIGSNVSNIGHTIVSTGTGEGPIISISSENPYFYIENDFLMEKSTLRAVLYCKPIFSSITWPENVKILEEDLLRYIWFSEDITIPETVEELRASCMNTNSVNIYLNKNIKVIKKDAFDAYVPTERRKVYIPMSEATFVNNVNIEDGWDSEADIIFLLKSLNKLQYYSNTNFQNSDTLYYDGTKFVKVEPKLYQDGVFK